MKSYLKIIFWILFPTIISFSALKAQVKEAYFHKDTFTISESVASLGQSIFINKCRGGYFDSFIGKQQLLRLDHDLVITDSLGVNQIFNIPANHEVYCTMISSIGVNQAVAIFNQQYQRVHLGITYRFSKMHILLFDSLLNVNHQFTLNSDSVYLRLGSVTLDKDTLYFTGHVADTLFKNLKSIIIKSTKDGSWTKAKTYPQSIFIDKPVFSTMFFKDEKILVSLSSHFNGAERFVILDRDFNLLESLIPRDTTGPDFFFHAFGFFVDVPNEPPVFMSSLSLFRTDIQPQTYYFMMGVGQFDSSLHIAQIDSFPYSGFDRGDFIGPKPYLDAFDYESPDSAVMIMPGQEINAMNFSFQDSNDMYIYNYNAVTKSMNWIKVYNSGYSNSMVSAVEVLPGNRYLIMLNEYNWDKYSYPNTSIHLMILDSKGNIVGEEEHPYLRNHLTVYPNPFSHELRVEGLPERSKPFTYTLYNMSGQELESGKLGEDGTIITTTQQTGSYIIQILDEGKVYQNIPVIKK